jgi:peptidyl-tRNA hydrolase, PTH1 family
MKFLIVGLGNIGTEYVETRHNIGFDVLDVFAAKHGGKFSSERLADVCEIKFKGRILVLIKPTTYMNLSGKAFKYWMDKEKVSVNQTLTIVDDLAFPIHVMKLRGSGSDAGHNGLKSIQELIGTNAYPKLRFGIGNNFPKGRQADYVLGRWTDEEVPVVNKKVGACCEVIENFVTIGIDRAMNLCNNIKFEL